MSYEPFLHDLVVAYAAPTQLWSRPDGEVDGAGAQGLFHGDERALGEISTTVDGVAPELLTCEASGGRAVISSMLRNVEAEGLRRTELADTVEARVRLDRTREVSPGRLTETMIISSALDVAVTADIAVRLATDGLDMSRIKQGGTGEPTELNAQAHPAGARWRVGALEVALHSEGAEISTDDPTMITVHRRVEVPAHGRVETRWSVEVSRESGMRAAAGPGLDVEHHTTELIGSCARAGVEDHRLEPLLRSALSDLNGLRMASADSPDDAFFAAGVPWYLTLFGRDSLWTARLLLPIDVRHALGTLRTLARLQGTTTDRASAEQPGKIPHEIRDAPVTLAHGELPPVYYGTIDATQLWICLLHETWRTGPDDPVIKEAVRDLIPTLERALDWLRTDADPDGDGFCEYLDESGSGLLNQGWKDSEDSMRFADGRFASGAVALSEVQGYCYQAAVAGAELLDAFDRPGEDEWRAWAARLAEAFRAAFWCSDERGRYPALALDGDKNRVDAVASDMGHLLGTGILNAEESELVARRVTSPELDSGLGLRTMSERSGGYVPLSYHCGSVWPHDTAIVIDGLVRAGQAERAAGLVEGLLRAATRFDYRLPELWSGEGAAIPYPYACRPQAWSAAAAVTVATALARGAHRR